MSKYKNIRLSYNELVFMLNHLSMNTALKNSLKNMPINFKISENDADELRNLCTDELDVSGFDEDYELTDAGKILEILIDKLFIG